MTSAHVVINVETEAKFALPTKAVRERLRATPTLAGMRVGRPSTTRTIDTYLDSETGAVAAAGYAWRRRDEGGHTTTTLKALRPATDGVHRREEMSTAADGPPQTWPEGPVRDLALRVVGDAPLVPVVTIEQERTTRSIRSGRRVVATLSLDRVTARRGDLTQRYWEAEVELGPHGTEADLAALAACLRDEWHLRPVTQSKLARAMQRGPGRLLTDEEREECRRLMTRGDLHGRRAIALVAVDRGATQADAAHEAGMSPRRVRHWVASFRARRMGVFPDRVRNAQNRATSGPMRPDSAASRAPSQGPLTPDHTMAEAALHTLGRQLERLVAHEAGTRAGEDPEELHDMRVAVRRMRAALLTLGEYLNAGRVRRLRKELRCLGRRLGAVRDLDVFGERSEAYLATVPASRRDELQPLCAAWSAERARARQRLLEYLDGPRYAHLVAACQEFVSSAAPQECPAFDRDGSPFPRRIGHVLPAVVYARLAAVRAFEEWVEGPATPIGLLHRLRIAAKALRYTLEFFVDVLGPEAASAVEMLKGLQDHLGEIHDTAVAITLLRDFLTWGTWGHEEGAPAPIEPVLAPGVAAYMAERQRDLVRLLDEFPARWGQIRGRGLTDHIASALCFIEGGGRNAA